MSKSYNNDIAIADTPEDTATKISKMFTDPQKIHKNDPGRPDTCPVYHLHKIYTEEHQNIHTACSAGKLGCVEDKKNLAINLNQKLKDIREERKNLEHNLETVSKVLREGAEKAREKARKTMREVRKAMRLS